MKRKNVGGGGRAARQPAAAGMTRPQVAEQLGTSVASIRRKEGKTLHPVKGADGIHRFDPAEVAAHAAAETAAAPAKLRRSVSGDLAAEAFIRFDKGLTPRQVVIELRQPPEDIEKLHRQWRDAGGLWLPSPSVSTLRRYIKARYGDGDGVRFSTPQQFVDVITRVLQDLDDLSEQRSDLAADNAALEKANRVLRRMTARNRQRLDDWERSAEEQESAMEDDRQGAGASLRDPKA